MLEITYLGAYSQRASHVAIDDQKLRSSGRCHMAQEATTASTHAGNTCFVRYEYSLWEYADVFSPKFRAARRQCRPLPAGCTARRNASHRSRRTNLFLSRLQQPQGTYGDDKTCLFHSSEQDAFCLSGWHDNAPRSAMRVEKRSRKMTSK